MKRLMLATLLASVIAGTGCKSPMIETRVLRANPGGPYTADSERDVTFTAAASTASPTGSLVRFRWNCGQATGHRVNCTPDNISPTFRYAKSGPIAGGPVTFTVTLTVEDTLGSQNTATTTVTVRQIY